MNGMIHLIITTLAMLCDHHHGIIAGLHHHSQHAVTVAKTVTNYALHPCAAGHPPVSPDQGACQGTKFIAS